MPVTKTAKRALRSSKKKESLNKKFASTLDMVIRKAKRDRKQKDVDQVFSLLDRAAKNNFIHQKKADRLKRRIVQNITRT